MSDREKLINLVKGAFKKCCSTICTHCKEYDPDLKASDRTCQARLFADHLLANGVTFATDTNVGGKWISVTDRLPETNDSVLVLHKNRHVCTNAWLKKAWWIDYGRNPITHWMPFPEPPKEV